MARITAGWMCEHLCRLDQRRLGCEFVGWWRSGSRGFRSGGTTELTRSLAPIPRLNKPALPHSGASFLCSSLLRRISPLAVSRPIQRMALPHHPGCDVRAISSEAFRHHPLVPIAFNLDASCRPAACEIFVEGEGGSLAAPVISPLGVLAKLAALWGVDPIEPDPLPRISTVSPSITEARPTNSPAFAVETDRTRASRESLSKGIRTAARRRRGRASDPRNNFRDTTLPLHTI